MISSGLLQQQEERVMFVNTGICLTIQYYYRLVNILKKIQIILTKNWYPTAYIANFQSTF